MYGNNGIFSGVMQGLSNIATNKAYQVNTSNQILYYYFIATTLVLACTLPYNWKMPSEYQFIDLAYISLFGALSTVLYTKAFKCAPAYVLSPFALAAIVFSAIFDWIVWGKLPESFMLIGSSILLVGLVMATYNKSTKNG